MNPTPHQIIVKTHPGNLIFRWEWVVWGGPCTIARTSLAYGRGIGIGSAITRKGAEKKARRFARKWMGQGGTPRQQVFEISL